MFRSCTRDVRASRRNVQKRPARCGPTPFHFHVLGTLRVQSILDRPGSSILAAIDLGCFDKPAAIGRNPSERRLGEKNSCFSTIRPIPTSAVGDHSVWNPEIHWRFTTMRMMTSKSLGIALAAFAGWMIMVLPVRAQPAPFAGLPGLWTGSGSIALSDGSLERLRCRATYRVADSGTRLQQTLRCASDSYRFDLSSDVVSDGAQLSGTWSESSRGISGTLQGQSNSGRISAVADAAGFSANLNLTTRGNRQSVSIVSQGAIRDVSITMIRS